MSHTDYNLSSLVAATFQRLGTQGAPDGEEFLSTGFRKLDKYAGKPKLGELMVVTAPRGMGCSAFAISLALNVAKGGQQAPRPRGVLYVSSDQTALRIAEWLLQIEARTRLKFDPGSHMTPYDWKTVTTACNALSGVPIRVEDRPFDSADALSVYIAEAAAAAAASGIALGLVVIDSLPTLARALRVPVALSATKLATLFQDLSAELGVVTLATLPTRHENGWQVGPLSPFVSVADRVIELERPSYYDPFEEHDEGDPVELRVVRNRSGNEPHVHVRYRRETRGIEDCDD